MDYRRLDTLIDSRRRDMREFLREAITHSTPCNPERGVNGPNCQHLVSSRLVEMGLIPDVWVPDAAAIRRQYPTMGYDITYDNRPNVVAVWRGKGTGPSIVLNTHGDVYGPGNTDNWSHAPFAGHVEGDRIYGRGAADAKGSLTAMLYAIEVLRDYGYEPGGDIVFQSVGDVEGGGNGTVSCLLRGYTGDAVIVGEPTGLALCPGSRGVAQLRLRVKGREVHSGVAYEGVNAVDKATLYIGALRALERRLDAQCDHPLWKPYPSTHAMNIEWIHAGGQGGVVPGVCDLGMTLGCIGGETLEGLHHWVTEAVDEVTRADPWLATNPPDLFWGPIQFEPSANDPAHPFIRALADSFESTIDRPATIKALSAASDLRFFTNYWNTPGAIFGPGDLRVAHSIGEYVDLEDVVRAMKVLVRTIISWTSRAKLEPVLDERGEPQP